jgi:hypothetical protein
VVSHVSYLNALFVVSYIPYILLQVVVLYPLAEEGNSMLK